MPEPLRVGFLTPEYPPLRSGGIGTSIRNLARTLVELGHGVSVLGWGHDYRADDEGVAVSFVPETRVPKMGWLLNRRRALARLDELASRGLLDIVEAPDWCGPSAGIRPRCPVVIRCNGSATYFAHLEQGRVRPSVRWAEAIALRGAADVAAVSRFAGDTTREIFGLQRAIRWIPNGVDVTRFRPAPAGGAPAGGVLHYGALVRKKGVLDLPAIFEGVLREEPGARFEVAGLDAPDARTGAASTWALCQRDLSARAAARTSNLGPQPYESMLELIRGASVCVFPSYAEALPMAWLEAMACAKAVVAYDIGWASELIVSGRSGLLVPGGDTEAFAAAVVRLLRSPALAGELGREARRRVEAEFSSRRVAELTVDWYREVLARR